jgi:hypothetical protein
MSNLCIGDTIHKLDTTNNNIRLRKEERQMPYSSMRDSVLYIELLENDEVLTYSTITLQNLDSNSTINFLSTNSRKLSFKSGVKVGYPYKDLNKLIPDLTFYHQAPNESLTGQVRLKVPMSDTSFNLIVINYGEVIENSIMDTLITSISIVLRVNTEY